MPALEDMDMIDQIRKQLGDKASLLDYTCQGIPKLMLHLPGPDFVDRVVVPTDRPINVLRSLASMFKSGAWPARDTFRSSRWTRASSTPAPLRSLPTLLTSTPKTS